MNWKDKDLAEYGYQTNYSCTRKTFCFFSDWWITLIFMDISFSNYIKNFFFPDF